MTVMREQEIARYVDRVRAALADLPPGTRDELVEDLPEHLAEVAAEADGSLVDRLGPPEAYAAELRAAAGAAAPTSPPNVDRRIGAAVVAVRGRLRAVDSKLGPMLGYDQASDFLRLLRPAWWVLRGYLVAMFITVVLNSGDSLGLLPRLGGSTLGGVLLLAVTVFASIWLGRRGGRFSRWPRLLLNVGTAFLFVFGLVGFVTADERTRSTGYSYQPSYNDNPYSNVQDVYVYDSQGRLVENARLFDQDGQPIRLGYPWCPEAQQGTVDPVRQPYPYCPQGAPFQLSGPTATAPTAPATAPAPGATPPVHPATTPTPTPPGPPASPTPTS
jgi:hypothetical protein